MEDRDRDDEACWSRLVFVERLHICKSGQCLGSILSFADENQVNHFRKYAGTEPKFSSN